MKVLLEATTQIHCSGPRAILLAAHRLPLCLGRIGGGERLETVVPAVGVEQLEQLEQEFRTVRSYRKSLVRLTQLV